MFNGAHIVICSTDAEADRAVFRNVLGMSHVDAGDGWLIFALPPAEVAFHPHETSGKHEFYFMCDDVEAARMALAQARIDSTPTEDHGWGLVSSFVLPGGGTVGYYQPRHARA